MTVEVTHELHVCTDCVQLIANTEATDEHRALVAARWPTEDLVLSYDEDFEGEFSWRQCDGCGSWLGGERYPAVVLAEVPA